MERTMETNVEQQYKLFNLIWNAISLWLKYCNFTNDLKELKLLFLWSKVITKAFLDFFFFLPSNDDKVFLTSVTNNGSSWY